MEHHAGRCHIRLIKVAPRTAEGIAPIRKRLKDPWGGTALEPLEDKVSDVEGLDVDQIGDRASSPRPGRTSTARALASFRARRAQRPARQLRHRPGPCRVVARRDERSLYGLLWPVQSAKP